MVSRLYMVLLKTRNIFRYKRFIAATGIITLVLLLLTRGGADSDKIQTTSVQTKTLESTVVASGKVKSTQMANLRFSTSGKISWLGIQKGDYVRQGQIIAKLNTQELEKRFQKDLNLYFKTRLDFDELKDSQEDKVITDTLKRLAQKSQVDLDNAVIDVELRGLAIKFASLPSPIEGYVIEEPTFWAETNVFPADVIAKIASVSQPIFVAEVDETEVGKIKTNQKVHLTFDAFPEEELQTTVKTIYPQAITTSTGATIYEVVFELPREKDLKLGMNGQARITIDQAENAVVVPTEAILAGQFVWVKTDREFQKRQVSTSLKTETESQILTGLQEAEIIIISGFEEIEKKTLLQKLIERISK